MIKKKKQQRTNGPVNAYLISGPTISTKASFAKFDIVLKWSTQGQHLYKLGRGLVHNAPCQVS